MTTAPAHKTAIRRLSLSRPVALALDDGLISRNNSVFDYGCGRGGDILRLHRLGVTVTGWDPAYFPDEDRQPADVVNLGYVVNVIENLEERAVVLGAAWALTRKVLVVSARLEWEARTLDGLFPPCGHAPRRGQHDEPKRALPARRSGREARRVPPRVAPPAAAPQYELSAGRARLA